jgi:hypothetical protein
MCGLCGIFVTETHWADAQISSREGGGRTRRHERLHRVGVANRVLRHYGLKLSDWHGSAYLLSTQTGQTSIVPSIAAAWPIAEQLRRCQLDPLDEALIAMLERESLAEGGA